MEGATRCSGICTGFVKSRSPRLRHTPKAIPASTSVNQCANNAMRVETLELPLLKLFFDIWRVEAWRRKPDLCRDLSLTKSFPARSRGKLSCPQLWNDWNAPGNAKVMPNELAKGIADACFERPRAGPEWRPNQGICARCLSVELPVILTPTASERRGFRRGSVGSQ